MFDDYQFEKPKVKRYYCVCGARLPVGYDDETIVCERCGYAVELSTLEDEGCVDDD